MRQFKTIVDAYNWLKDECENGYRQDIQRGSFENEETYRMQSRPVALEISDPMNFIYLPKEVTVGIIDNYYQEYIINLGRKENEKYTYGERIMQQLPAIFEMLSSTPKTNQASVSISQPDDISLSDPPCMREIVFSFFDDKLNLSSFWRSNDIGAAFLTNQGGLAYLLRDVAEYTGLPMGSLFYSSPGAHIYVR